MTWSSYRSTLARLVASHEALGFWNRYAGGESTACWTQRVRLPGVRSPRLQQCNSTREVGSDVAMRASWHGVSEGLSERGV